MTHIFNKVSLQTNLERNPSNSSYIFIMSMNFVNLALGLYVLIISFMLAKFQEGQRSITMSSNDNISSFCDLKLCKKKKFIDRIVNNIQFE